MQKRSLLHGAATLKDFPKDVATFVHQYPASYPKAHPPVPCRVDEHAIQERCCTDNIPCRGSAKRISSKRKSTPVADHHRESPQTEPTINVMKMMMEFMVGRRTAPPALQNGDANGGVRLEVCDGNNTRRCNTVDRDIGLTLASQSQRVEDVPARDASGGQLKHGVAGCLRAPEDTTVVNANKMRELRERIKTAAAKTKTDATVAPIADSDVEIPDDDDEVVSVIAPHVAAEAHPGAAAPKACVKAKGKGRPKGKAVAKPKACPKAKPLADKPKAKPLAKKAKKSEAGAAKALEHARLLKRPAACARPAFSKTPTSHCGGKIYFANAKKALRVYLRTPVDKIEKYVGIDVDSKADRDNSWKLALAMIENDPRPMK
jgi:hypothetical protein